MSLLSSPACGPGPLLAPGCVSGLPAHWVLRPQVWLGQADFRRGPRLGLDITSFSGSPADSCGRSLWLGRSKERAIQHQRSLLDAACPETELGSGDSAWRSGCGLQGQQNRASPGVWHVPLAVSLSATVFQQKGPGTLASLLPVWVCRAQWFLGGGCLEVRGAGSEGGRGGLECCNPWAPLFPNPGVRQASAKPYKS